MSAELSLDMSMAGAAPAAADNLAGLRPGESARVGALLVEGALRRRLLDLGLVRGTVVKCVGKSPAGDPSAYLIRGAVIALRAGDSAMILLDEAGRGEAQWA